MPAVRAITFDLDDTLWPIAPAIERAEAALLAWLEQACPAVTAKFDLHGLRTLREQVAAERPELAHDFTAQRRLSLARALEHCDADPALVDGAFDAFFAARNQVELFPGVDAALARLARRLPIAAVTNGNADLAVIGLAHHFRFQLGAREFGAAKPDPSIFLAACQRLDCAPGEVLHVGDDPHMDVVGARRAGLRAVWFNRPRQRWQHDHEHRPEHHVATLDELVDWVENEALAPAA